VTHLNPIFRVDYFLHCFLRIELLISDFPLIASPLKAAINERVVLGLPIRGIALCLTRQGTFVVILTEWRREQELPL
jgi:hypothetical protein